MQQRANAWCSACWLGAMAAITQCSHGTAQLTHSAVSLAAASLLQTVLTATIYVTHGSAWVWQRRHTPHPSLPSSRPPSRRSTLLWGNNHAAQSEPERLKLENLCFTSCRRRAGTRRVSGAQSVPSAPQTFHLIAVPQGRHHAGSEQSRRSPDQVHLQPP